MMSTTPLKNQPRGERCPFQTLPSLTFDATLVLEDRSMFLGPDSILRHREVRVKYDIKGSDDLSGHATGSRASMGIEVTPSSLNLGS
jgi:hypothetical protein